MSKYKTKSRDFPVMLLAIRWWKTSRETLSYLPLGHSNVSFTNFIQIFSLNLARFLKITGQLVVKKVWAVKAVISTLRVKFHLHNWCTFSALSSANPCLQCKQWLIFTLHLNWECKYKMWRLLLQVEQLWQLWYFGAKHL